MILGSALKNAMRPSTSYPGIIRSIAWWRASLGAAVEFAGPGAVCAKAGVNPTAATPVKSAAARNGVRNLIISDLCYERGSCPSFMTYGPADRRIPGVNRTLQRFNRAATAHRVRASVSPYWEPRVRSGSLQRRIMSQKCRMPSVTNTAAPRLGAEHAS